MAELADALDLGSKSKSLHGFSFKTLAFFHEHRYNCNQLEDNIVNIDSIRKAFFRGNIILSPDKLIVSYNILNDWFVQDFEETELWLSLLDNCTAFSIINAPGKHVWFVFQMDTASESTIMIPAIEGVEKFDIDKLLSDFKPDTEIEKSFLASFDGADLNDGNDLIERCSQWLESQMPSRRFINLDGINRSKLMRAAFKKLIAGGFVCDTYITDVSEYSDGEFTLELSKNSHLPSKICGDTKQAFRDLVELSTAFGVEGNISDGLLRISFWV